MQALGVPFTFVRRLTAVKFSASRRRDAYRHRPSHEQAAWFERIGREPDFETVELVRMLYAAGAPRTFLRRQWGRVTGRLRHVAGYERGVLNPNRRFKGLGPLP